MATRTIAKPNPVTAVTTSTPPPAPKSVNLNEVDTGDVFSENSHYVYRRKEEENYVFLHLATKKEVTLGASYVENNLIAADQYNKVVEVGKEDTKWTEKQIGELPDGANKPREADLKQRGIRSIWNNIAGHDVFHVVYITQGKKLTVATLEELKDEQRKKAMDAVDAAMRNKKSMVEAYEEGLKTIQDNPIPAITDGARRELYGYKIQFESSTGYFDVIDMKIDPNLSNQRQVNINTIQELTYRGVKYIVK